LLTALALLTAVAVTVIVVIDVQVNRDEVISRMKKKTPDRFALDRQFVTTLVTRVLPLVGLLVTLSYGMSDLIRSLLEPLFR
ncbi:MAG: hypothetical protein JO329_13825, partial [Planctomycetaceae bacterium]|nr:hypothetical protein [Planctomycetaceae bacterium]